MRQVAAIRIGLVATTIGLVASQTPAESFAERDRQSFEVGETIQDNGIAPILNSAESDVVITNLAGRGGIRVRTNGAASGGGMIYFRVGPTPDAFRNWKGDRAVTVTISYYDGAKGVIQFVYDSNDFTWRLPPYPDGVFKPLDVEKAGLVLTGSGQWKTVSFELPMPLFQRRCHGGDFRIGWSCAPADGFAIHSIVIARTDGDGWGVIE